jgi:hypothetical protein
VEPCHRFLDVPPYDQALKDVNVRRADEPVGYDAHLRRVNKAAPPVRWPGDSAPTRDVAAAAERRKPAEVRDNQTLERASIELARGPTPAQTVLVVRLLVTYRIGVPLPAGTTLDTLA